MEHAGENKSATIKRRYWRVQELPELTGMSEAYWRKLISARKIPVIREGRSVLIDDDVLRERFARKSQAEAA